MRWLRWCSHGSLVVSSLSLVLAIVAKVGEGELAGVSARSLYALALIMGVYSVAFSVGRGSGQTGAE